MDHYRPAAGSQASDTPSSQQPTETPSVPSVFVNPKDPHSVQLRQFGNENSEQGHSVDHKMGLVIFGVKAGEDVSKTEKTQTIINICNLSWRPLLNYKTYPSVMFIKCI